MKQKFSCEKCGYIQEEIVNGKEEMRNWYLTAYRCKKCSHVNNIADVDWKGVRDIK